MPKLKVAFLDVGHGDFAYIVTPLGDTMVIDIGSGDITPSNYLKPITMISELQVSHPHTDHFDDIAAMEGKTVKSFRCPAIDKFTDNVIGWRKTDRVKIEALRKFKQTVGIDNNAVRSQNGFSHSVWVPTNVDYEDPNTASLVTLIAYQGVKFLFGGDLPSEGWENLLAQPGFATAIAGTAVFKVPHHGREEGCCQTLFDTKEFKPLLCIISDKSLEKDNQNTESTDWYTQRASGVNVVGYEGQRKVLTTRSDGSIFVEVNDEGKWWVHPNTSWKKD